ncbi:MAG: ADP-ribosylglycohydrolase family protein [Treponema sp.]|nr:ADP-ribosylglycohydrolase family protein [Treponema sp.]
MTQTALPRVLAEEDQTWDMMRQIGESADALLTAQWSSAVPGSAAPESLIAGAVQSMENMGRRVEDAERILEEGLKVLAAGDIQKLRRITARLWRTLDTLPIDPRSSYWDYTAYRNFEMHERAVSLPAPVPVDIQSDDFYDRTRAAWVGRIAGGALGTALEGYATAQLRKKFGDIRGYARKPNTYNDDITFEIAFLIACVQKGRLVSSADIADQWLELIPGGWSAEQVALDNLRRGIYPPDPAAGTPDPATGALDLGYAAGLPSPPTSGSWKNPYREWIGAQMRGAVCGQAAPGNPREAARLAWLDGVVSHTGNGVLGEVFNALLVSLAFIESDMRRCLDRAIALIPADSEYYSVLQFARRQAEDTDFEAAWAACEERFKRYNWVHAYPNAAAEVVALWFGNGDFDETMHCAAMCGQDADCNAAQIAAALGAQQGCGAIDERWLLGETVQTYMRGDMRHITLKFLTDQTVKAAALLKQ